MTKAGIRHFDRVLDFIEEKTGTLLPETNYRHVGSYLAERTEALNLDITAYLGLLEGDETERTSFFNAITINETYFFREERHYTALDEHIFPALKTLTKRPIILWSAACSTGEEALSLAALAAGFWPPGEFRVYASDINTRALAHLRRGIYGGNSFRDDGRGFHPRLDPFCEQKDGRAAVSKDLLERVAVIPLNLSSPVYSGIPSGVHLVFLRNMLIYTRFELRSRIIDTVTSLMAEDGCLFLSSSEVPLLAHPDLTLENYGGCYYFRKKTLQEKKTGIVPGAAVLKRSGEPAAPRPKRKPEVAQILRHAGRRLNNPLYEVPDDEAFTAALDYLEAVYFLNSGELGKAGRALDALITAWGQNEITDYLQGLTALRREDPGEAKKHFRTAAKKDPGFWPAIFQLALLIRQEEPEKAAREFAAALRSIGAYIARDAFTYQFLLEGFNAKYFAGICEGWIAKLRSKGAAHGA